MLFQIDRLYRISSNLIYLFVCIFVFVKGALYFPDSYGFLEMNFHQSFVYNLFLKILTIIFRDSFEIPLIIIQIGLIIIATRHLIKTFKTSFELNCFWLLLFQVIILAPVLYLHFIANAILTEGLAYSFFLLFASHSINGFISENKTHYFYALLMLLFLIMVRGQFIAMTVVVLVLLIFEAIQSSFKRENIILILAVISLPFISELIEKSYNKLAYNHFVSTPFDNISIISAAFFVSDSDDFNIYTNEEEQNFFKYVYRSLDSLDLTKEKISISDQQMYQVFHKKYVYICNHSIHEKGKSYFEKKGFIGNEQLLAVNNITGNMLIPLIKDNFKAWLRLYIDNIKNGFGSFKYLLLYLLLLVSSGVLLFKSKHPILKLIFITTLMVFANKMIIPIAVHSIKRYMFYTDWVIFVIIILLLNELFTKNNIIDDRG